MQTNRSLNLSSSFLEINFRYDLFRKKNETRKISFCGKKLNCISCSLVCFLLRIPQYSVKNVAEKKSRQAIGKCYAFQANAIKHFSLFLDASVVEGVLCALLT